jgi:hypothetical protein
MSSPAERVALLQQHLGIHYAKYLLRDSQAFCVLGICFWFRGSTVKRTGLYIIFLSCVAALFNLAMAGVEDSEKWRRKSDNSPGVVLDLEETARITLKDGTPEVTYRISASGFPQSKTYSLWFDRVGEESRRFVDKLYVDDSGIMIVQEIKPDYDVPYLPAPMAEVLPLTVDHFQPGEPVSISLISEDEEIKGHVKAFPIPIEDTDGSCRLYLELINPDRTAFAAWGEGFLPNEELATDSRSNGELIESRRDAEADGGFLEILLPEVQGKTAGSASYRVTSSYCSLKVEYDWGRR